MGRPDACGRSRMRPRRWLLVGALAAGLAGGAAGEELISLAPLDEITIRRIPAFPVVDAEVIGDIEIDWEPALRKCARYAAQASQEFRRPVVIIYPEWETKEPQRSGKMQVRLLLDPRGKLPAPIHKGVGILEMPATYVAAYAYRGAYTRENLVRALTKIRKFLKERRITASGPPRYLLHSNTDWTPQWLRVSEVQVPIPNQAPAP